MHSRTHRLSKWQRFNRDHGVKLFIAILVVFILGLMVLLMWLLARQPGVH